MQCQDAGAEVVECLSVSLGVQMTVIMDILRPMLLLIASVHSV